MEKSEISSLDLKFLAKELASQLKGGRFQKIYQYKKQQGDKSTHEFLFEIHVSGVGEKWLYVDKNKVYLTSYRKPGPLEPPMFCLFLRKHLSGERILSVEQHDFERILEITTAKNRLIIELFSDGNVILTDVEGDIIMPLYIQTWKDREVKPKKPYAYPPAKVNPFSIEFDQFDRFIRGYDKKTGAVLAAAFGFGPVYSKEVCALAGVKEDVIAKRLTMEDTSRLHRAFQAIAKTEPKPTAYEGFVSPFPLQSMAKGSGKKIDSLSEALDEHFSGQQIQAVEKKEEKAKEEHLEKYERIIEQQKQAVEKHQERKEESKGTGDLLYKHFAAIEAILESIRKEKDSGSSWDEIKKKAREGRIHGAYAIKEIMEDKGKVLVELEGQEIELDFRKSVQENAAQYYEDSKFSKKKIVGAQEAMEKTKELMEAGPEDDEEEDRPTKVVKKKGKWYEKFRWFITSDGFLVAGGKDATSNEVLIKKHTEPADVVFHSDIHGAPFIVTKAEGKEVTATAKKESSEFAAAYSKAWQMGLANVDVYSVKPEQVSKQPPSGEYLPKGSFMIYGQREWFREVELKLSIGVKINKGTGETIVASGPVMAMRKHMNYFLTVKPGQKEAADLATEIKNKLLMKATFDDRPYLEKTTIDLYQSLIPGGTGQIVEYGV